MKEQKTADHPEDVLFRHVQTVQNLGSVIDAMQEFSDLQNAELLAWKESAMRELNALDLQSLGRKLGIRLGQSVSENVHSKVDGLLERVNELEGALTATLNVARACDRGRFVDILDKAEKTLKK